MALYHQSQQFLDDATKISQAAQQGKGFFKAFGNAMSDMDTWDFGISQLTRSANLKDIVERYEQGAPLTDAEKTLMDSAVAYISACAYNSDKLNRRYKAGQTTGESLPFMLQFMVMPIDAVKSKVAKGILGYGIEQFGGKAAQAAGKTAAKYTAGTAFKEAGTALLGNLAAAGMQTAVFGIPKIAEGAISRMTGDIEPAFDEDGNIVYGGRANQQSAGEAIYNATIDQYVENLSEMILTSTDPLKAYAGTTRLFKGLKSTEIARILGKMNEGVIGKIRKRAQFRNYLEEVSEEYVGGLMRWGLSTDVNNADEAGFSIDQQIDTRLGLAPTSLFFAGLGALRSAAKRVQSALATARLRKIVEEGGERKYLEDLLRSGNSDDFSRAAHATVKKALRDKKLNKEEKRFLPDYVYATYRDKVAEEAAAAKEQAQAEQRQAALAKAEADIAPITNTDGNVYAVTRADDPDKSGHIVSGKVEVEADPSDPKRQIITNADVVTVRYADGSIEQIPARDLNLAGAPVAEADVVEQSINEQVAAEQTQQQAAATFHAGQEVTMTDADGNTHTSRVVSVSDEGVEVEITDADGKPNTTIVPAATALTSLQPVAEKEQSVQEGVEHYRDQKDKEVAFYRHADGSVTLVDEKNNPVLDKEGNAVVMSADEFNRFATDSQLTRTDNAETDITNPQPIGTNQYGNIYQWVLGKAKEAAKFLRKNRGGYLKGVFHRDDIGNIDLVWGNDKAGLQHIIRRHIEEQDDFDSINEAIDAIGQTIQNGKIISNSDRHCTIDDGTYRVGIAKDEQGNWVLTAYDNSRSKEDKQRNGVNQSPLVVPSTERANPSDVAFSHQENDDTVSADKGTTISANTQKNIPDIDTMSSDELGASTVEYMGGVADAKTYLQAERDKAEKEVKRLAKQKIRRYTDAADFKRQNDELKKARTEATDRLNKLEQALIAIDNHTTQVEQTTEQQPANPQTEPAVPSTPTGNERGRGDASDTGNVGGRQQSDLETAVSEELDEFGNPFIVSKNGTTTFGTMRSESGLAPLPIKLSSGANRYDEKADKNIGYGKLHIEAGHGEQIRKAGFESVEDFVEYVAQNYNVIKLGGTIADNQTFLLELTDNHNNTLFVQLSRDNSYWTVNSAGVFKKSYSSEKPIVWSLPAVESSTSPETTEVNSGSDKGTNRASGNSSQTSERSNENSVLHPTSQVEESVPLNDSHKPTKTDNQPAVLGINSSGSISDGKGTANVSYTQAQKQKSSLPAEEAAARTDTQRLEQERRERILREGTSYDKAFGLVAPKDITSPQQITDNIQAIVEGLALAEKALGEKGNSNAADTTHPLHDFSGWVYGEGHNANAQHRIEGYLTALDVLDPAITNEWQKQTGLKTYDDLRKYVEKIYNEAKAAQIAKLDQLQEQIDGTLPQGHIYQLGMPSRILRSAGIPNLPIELSADRLKNKSVQANHPFQLSEVRNLPQAIHDPIAVFESSTHKNDGS